MMFDEFLIRAALAGVGVAIAAGPIGCVIVWRGMAFFSDATAHAAVLGVAIALALEVPMIAGVLVTALAMATAVSGLARQGASMDTALGVLSHSALAFGLVAVSLMPGVRTDLLGLLLGDILSVGWTDVALIWGGGGLALGLLIWRWSSLLMATLNPDLAHASGVTPAREHLIQTIALALVVAVALQIVGALLVAAMLLIPAATARQLAGSPEAMAAWASLLGVGAVIGGLRGAFTIDTPAGPSIVAAAALGFAAVSVLRALRG